MKIVEQRRSVYPRMFSKEVVSREEVEKLLEVSRWAPTHKLTQPWFFRVYMGQGKEKLRSIMEECLDSQTMTSEVMDRKREKLRFNLDASSAIVAIVLKRDPNERIPYFEELASVACAVQNFWLCLRPMGLAGYWSTGSGTDSSIVRSALNLSEKDQHLGWFYLGKSTLELPLPENRKTISDFVEWVE